MLLFGYHNLQSICWVATASFCISHLASLPPSTLHEINTYYFVIPLFAYLTLRRISFCSFLFFFYFLFIFFFSITSFLILKFNKSRLFSFILSSYWLFIICVFLEDRLGSGLSSRRKRSGLPKPLDGIDHLSQTTPVELLNYDLINEVAKHLRRFKDLMTMSSVSHRFRNALSSCNMHSDKVTFPACLMLTPNPERETQSFRSLYNNNTFEIDLPAAREKSLWGSQYGWMTTVDPRDFKSSFYTRFLKNRSISQICPI